MVKDVHIFTICIKRVWVFFVIWLSKQKPKLNKGTATYTKGKNWLFLAHWLFLHRSQFRSIHITYLQSQHLPLSKEAKGKLCLEGLFQISNLCGLEAAAESPQEPTEQVS